MEQIKDIFPLIEVKALSCTSHFDAKEIRQSYHDFNREASCEIGNNPFHCWCVVTGDDNIIHVNQNVNQGTSLLEDEQRRVSERICEPKCCKSSGGRLIGISEAGGDQGTETTCEVDDGGATKEEKKN